MKRLTAKQEAFAQAIADGKGPSDAYRSAYHTRASATVVSVAANRVVMHPAVVARIRQLRERVTASKTLERVEKREILARFVRDPKGAMEAIHSKAAARKIDERMVAGALGLTTDQLKAIEIDNRMAGHNEPEQLKVTGLGSVLQKIRRDAPKP